MWSITRTGIMVYSLYSEIREPTEEMVADIDTFVVDLQDVGCRIYTFIYTMANCMRAAKKFGKKVVVCDRPNPIGGNAVEGNITEDAFKSFVGQFELPTRHGMTIGELAKMFNEHFGIGCDLEVVAMEGWRREMWGDETGLPWVLAVAEYSGCRYLHRFPATVHVEGTELSEGRGTTLPFLLNGAPFIDPYAWAAELRKFDFPGVAFREAYFRPTFAEFDGPDLRRRPDPRHRPRSLHARHRRHRYDQDRLRYVSRPFSMEANAYEYVFDKNPFRCRLRNG